MLIKIKIINHKSKKASYPHLINLIYNKYHNKINNKFKIKNNLQLISNNKFLNLK